MAVCNHFYISELRTRSQTILLKCTCSYLGLTIIEKFVDFRMNCNILFFPCQLGNSLLGKSAHPRVRNLLKCHCNGKIVDLVLIATEQNFRTRLNGSFSFSISCLVSEIFRFLKHANNVIYSRIISYIYKTMNISGFSWQNLF